MHCPFCVRADRSMDTRIAATQPACPACLLILQTRRGRSWQPAPAVCRGAGRRARAHVRMCLWERTVAVEVDLLQRGGQGRASLGAQRGDAAPGGITLAATLAQAIRTTGVSGGGNFVVRHDGSRCDSVRRDHDTTMCRPQELCKSPPEPQSRLRGGLRAILLKRRKFSGCFYTSHVAYSFSYT